MAQESAPIAGDHVSDAAFTSELPDGQPLQLEVTMALNNRAQLTLYPFSRSRWSFSPSTHRDATRKTSSSSILRTARRKALSDEKSYEIFGANVRHVSVRPPSTIITWPVV